MQQVAAGVPWKDWVPLISLCVAILGFALTHFARIRSGCSRAWLTLLGALGVVRARYKAAFLKRYRELQNIYLNRIEKLDLTSTYVPLRVVDSSQSTSEVAAIELLLDPSQKRIVILGDPGTGKTTLLRSFGIGLVSPKAFVTATASAELARTAKLSARQNLLPIYVELRDFAAHLAEYPSLSDYIAKSVLPELLGGTDHTRFLREMLKDGRCTLLLDALDEVSDADYDRLRIAILKFTSDTDELMPTASARVILTSRVQNFLNVVTDWIPTGFERYSILAPLSDDSIRQFLVARAGDLPSGKTPEALWATIATSGTLELHRTPLILTISLGLYINIPRYEIPSSIARFYSEVVLELLQRHDFRTRTHLTKRNVFNADTKTSFLRQLALTIAQRKDQFEEFAYEEIADEFRTFQRRVASLDEKDGQAFIAEIVTGAGLIRKVTSTGTYVFAHRSFHEYFAAAQLARNAPSNLAEVLRRSSSPQWRQIVIFFMAMDHDCHEQLLASLADAAPELAGYCLGVTPGASIAVANKILDRLQASIIAEASANSLASLTAVARRTSGTMKERALRLIGDALRDIANSGTAVSAANALWQLNNDDLFTIVNGLAAIGGRDIARVLVATSRLAESDARFVGPLWVELRSLVDDPVCTETQDVVLRLLELAQLHEGLGAIERSAAFAVPFADERGAMEAFPFSAFPRRRNLVTLLMWAERCNARPDKPNAFTTTFFNRHDWRLRWSAMETELLTVRLSKAPRVMASIVFWGIWLAGLVRMFVLPWRYGFTASLLALSGMAPTLTIVSALGLILGTAISAGVVQPLLVPRRWSLAADPERAANPFPSILDLWLTWLRSDGTYFWDSDAATAIACLTVLGLPTFSASTAMLSGSPLRFLLAGVLGLTICFWIPALRLFSLAGPIITIDVFGQIPIDLSSLLWLDIKRPDLVERVRRMSAGFRLPPG